MTFAKMDLVKLFRIFSESSFKETTVILKELQIKNSSHDLEKLSEWALACKNGPGIKVPHKVRTMCKDREINMCVNGFEYTLVDSSQSENWRSARTTYTIKY